MTSHVPPRPTTRALVGTMALVVLMVIYVLAASALAVAILPKAGRIAEFLYYAVAGLAWVPPAGLIIKWMYAPAKATGDRR